MVRVFCFSVLLLVSPALLAKPSWQSKKSQAGWVSKKSRIKWVGKKSRAAWVNKKSRAKWVSKKSRAASATPKKLRPGQFVWKGISGGSGGMWAKISLPEQRLYLYQKGVLIGVSTVSTGTSDHRTPTGRFKVRGKTWMHRSKKYDNAPMPYTHWLTSKGVAMHAGRVPGYPASHGCIRLPNQFARLLYQHSPVGMPVVITQQSNKSESVHIYNKTKFPTLSSNDQDQANNEELLAFLTY